MSAALPQYPVSNKSSGVDDVLAMLLALAASPEEIDLMMISVTYGNVEVQRYKPHLCCR